MTADEFSHAKNRIMRTHAPATSTELSGTMLEMSMLMGDNDVLTRGGAHKTGRPKCMLSGRYRPATREVTADQVAQELERSWVEDISIGKEIHLITRSDSQVVLEFVMVGPTSGTYQTGQIVVDMANPGPIQRLTKAGKHRASRA